MAEDTPRSGSRTSERGFAAMDRTKQRAVASKGGSASGGNFKNDPERAARAGRKGGEHRNHALFYRIRSVIVTILRTSRSLLPPSSPSVARP